MKRLLLMMMRLYVGEEGTNFRFMVSAQARYYVRYNRWMKKQHSMTPLPANQNEI